MEGRRGVKDSGMGYDFVITGATVVGPRGREQVDVAVEGETIVAVGPGLAGKAKSVVDATGKFLIPGGLDVHVHLELPFCGTTSSDDWETGTRAAARGGVTTVIDFAIPYGEESLADAFANWIGQGRAEGVRRLLPSTWPSPTGTATGPRWPRWSRGAARRSRSS